MNNSHQHTRRPAPRAFALIELLAAALAVATLVALLLIATSRSRANAQQQGSLANLHEFAAITASYAADNTDHIWTFSWRRADTDRSQYPDLNGPYDTAFVSTAAQATDILRRRGWSTAMPLVNWATSPTFSHLVLADYLDQSAYLRFAVSPGDTLRVHASNDPDGYVAGNYTPPPPPQGAGPTRHFTFSSSYTMPPAFWSSDYATATRSTVVGGYNTFRLSPDTNLDFGTRRTTEILHPSRKVFLFDQAQWTGARVPIFWAYEFARPAKLMNDGSANARATSQANRGFQPHVPTSPFPTLFAYEPTAVEPPSLNSLSLQGHYMYTRNGLGGRDYDGLEVPIVP